MTPKEKAIQLAKQYYPIVNGGEQPDWVLRKAKECALIAVDEIIKSTPASSPENASFDAMPHFKAVKYWQEVKQEIEKL